MRKIVETFDAGLRPSPQTTLSAQGYPLGAAPPRVQREAERATELFDEFAAPRGIWADIGGADFAAVYRGRGENDRETPLGQIYPQAEGLALFAATMGKGLSAVIDERFTRGEFALAALLDAITSEATEALGSVIATDFGDWHRDKGGSPTSRGLCYSPGYCGWHLSGQAALFEHLRPEEIGIELQKSFLMRPLKSMTGVIVWGSVSIHDFEDRFPCCADCAERSCRERISALLA